MDVFFCTEPGRCFKPALSLYPPSFWRVYPPRAGMIQVPNSKGLRNGDAGACSLLSAIDIKKRESPLRQHAPGPDLAQ